MTLKTKRENVKCFFLTVFTGKGGQGEGNQGDGNQGEGNQGEGNQKPESSGDYAKGQLEKHNAFRAKHGSPPMTLDDEMSESAEKYAKHLAKISKLEHSDSKDRNGNGENLWYGCSSDTKVLPIKNEQATDDW